MPKVSTDDAARRLRIIYLGPVDFPLPWPVSFPTLGAWVAVTGVVALLSVALNPAGTRLWMLGVLAAPLVGVLATRKLMRRVDHDQPLRFWAWVLRAEIDGPRPVDNTPTTHVTRLQITPTPDRNHR